MGVANGMRAWPGGDSRGRTSACIPEPADGPVGTLRAAAFVLAWQIHPPRMTWSASQFHCPDRADRAALACAAPALRRLAVLT